MIKIDKPIETGFSFGLTSGVITTLGLMVGVYASTRSKLAVAGVILAIAIADALSDALGIHTSEEAQGDFSQKAIWETTLSVFLFKFVFTSLFIVPVLLLNLQAAVVVSVFLGLVLIGFLSWLIARQHRRSLVKVVTEHLLTTVLVILATHFLGNFIASVFG